MNAFFKVNFVVRKGGLIIYLHKIFQFDPKFKLSKYKTWEGQGIQVKKGETIAKPIQIVNIYIYRPPCENIESYNEFIDEFGLIWAKLSDVGFTGIMFITYSWCLP